jgi:antitoxin HicB
MPKKIRELKSLLRKAGYSMLIQWSDLDQVYVVSLPEFGGCKTHGDTYEKAAKNGKEVLELLIESCLEEGERLPPPARFDDEA